MSLLSFSAPPETEAANWPETETDSVDIPSDLSLMASEFMRCVSRDAAPVTAPGLASLRQAIKSRSMQTRRTGSLDRLARLLV
jgi:hypothetical protein